MSGELDRIVHEGEVLPAGTKVFGLDYTLGDRLTYAAAGSVDIVYDGVVYRDVGVMRADGLTFTPAEEPPC